MFDQGVWDRLRALAVEDATTHLVVFENHNFSSTRLGDKTAVVLGPGHTYETLDDVDGKWLNDLPSMRQYPVAYWEKDQ